jgi:probable rRNA maturation factor
MTGIGLKRRRPARKRSVMRTKRPRRAGKAGTQPGGVAADIVVRSPLWAAERRAKAVVRRALAATCTAVPTVPSEVAVLLADDADVRALNRTWRGKDERTNVLSFPVDPAPAARRPPGRPRERTAVGSARPAHRRSTVAAPRLLGDIVIAYETTAREAVVEGKPFDHHLAHLVVHGFLHLAGYDHETDAEAEAMEALEAAVLARLKVPNPYIALPVKG